MITEEFMAVWNALVEWGLEPETTWHDGELGIWVFVCNDELAAIAALRNFSQVCTGYSKVANETYHKIGGVSVTLSH